jgi:single-strand DNA-binding protein
MVEGKIENRSYETQDGETKYITEIVVSEFEFLDKREAKPNKNDSQQTGRIDQTAQADDLPF